MLRIDSLTGVCRRLRTDADCLDLVVRPGIGHLLRRLSRVLLRLPLIALLLGVPVMLLALLLMGLLPLLSRCATGRRILPRLVVI